MRYRIRLDTMSDVNNFVKMASKNPGKITLTDGENFTVNGKSLLGAMYTMEWKQVFCESENDSFPHRRYSPPPMDNFAESINQSCTNQHPYAK